ncbi:hypothetical protein NSQ77_18210 [Oceanobacillus sp. FSL K6-2867]|uniref:hypothetical protein n=1 Tax=Oceanobacillus sp. FSL K6-2867 TaxID=2954748 RepID=UPI0030D830EC
MSSDHINPDQQKIINQLIERYGKQLQDDKGNKDNSFVFLEKHTLQRFITFMMMILDKENSSDITSEEVESPDLSELIAYLDLIMEDNQRAFEELIHLLKEI